MLGFTCLVVILIIWYLVIVVRDKMDDLKRRLIIINGKLDDIVFDVNAIKKHLND